MRFCILAACLLLSLSTVLSSGTGEDYDSSEELDEDGAKGKWDFCEYLRLDCGRSIGRRAVACLSILHQNCPHVPLERVEEPIKIVKASGPGFGAGSGSGSAFHVKSGHKPADGVLLTDKERYATVTNT